MQGLLEKAEKELRGLRAENKKLAVELEHLQQAKGDQLNRCVLCQRSRSPHQTTANIMFNLYYHASTTHTTKVSRTS